MGLSRFKFNLSYPMTLLGAVIFLILGIRACIDLWSYARLTDRKEVIIDRWKVVKKSSSAFLIRATYHFEFQEKTYTCRDVLPPPYHLNRMSAEKAVQKLEKQRWAAWFDRGHPQISSLRKELPLKKIIYSLIALGITCYFVFLETPSKIRNPIH